MWQPYCHSPCLITFVLLVESCVICEQFGFSGNIHWTSETICSKFKTLYTV